MTAPRWRTILFIVALEWFVLNGPTACALLSHHACRPLIISTCE